METKTPKKPVAPRVDMPCQPAEVRRANFDEVALGYTREMAIEEAQRCLQCKKPLCVSGCPVEVPIRDFIREAAHGNMDAAYRIIKSTNSLPAVCGRVCPQEHQCEGKCVLRAKGQPVAIGRLERFVADTYIATTACEQVTGTDACALPRGDLKVACIGSGPSSLTCAGVCAAAGIKVDVYEALHEPGGVLIYGIPAFRLPKNVVATEIDGLRLAGVDFHLNSVGGRTVEVEELLETHHAVFIGVGAGLPMFLGVPGENLVGVFSANEYLTRVNLGRAYDFPHQDTPAFPGKNVTVFGAGNVAMDAARTALRMGAESVHIVYRRTRAEMPARLEELEHAEEEGVQFAMLSAPLRFNGNAEMRLTSVTLQKMELGEPDASGRRRPVAIEGEVFDLPTDLAVVALGTRSNPILLDATPKLKQNKWGYIEVNEETGETSMPNVFAGGDIVTGAATVILAMGAGRKAGQEIVRRLLK
ncbi:NADPH-dependent glutamate synthase [Desulfovibrio sp. 86]|uniref:Sulfide dehydrogenase subunit alpha n=1 Tax=uncultured Desulfovibrio sp. TaxID=167968 RepID=A0A212L2Z0_9BACT|nr:NADPH-dependent glutamate synthase [Desulfovibrio sp. 86]SCM71922.1 Sulfide dehydrogenase subunit alpha [uncultured Desulfovibrio sp.]VZH33188.1 Sulfide dehydrogenase subunit alpha [Desulfovibrio sp. 86]